MKEGTESVIKLKIGNFPIRTPDVGWVEDQGVEEDESRLRRFVRGFFVVG